MLITTTPNIEGKRIKEYLGIVTGEAVVGANLFRDLFAGLRDIVGGRAGAYEKELRKARNLAFEELTEAAQELGANAIVSVDIDYEVLGEVKRWDSRSFSPPSRLFPDSAASISRFSSLSPSDAVTAWGENSWPMLQAWRLAAVATA